MRQRIVIDATPLLYAQAGIGRLTRMLIESILALRPEYEIVLFGRRLLGGSLRAAGFGGITKRLRLPRASERFIKRVHLVDLLCRGDLYHATDFYMPIADAEKAVATIHDVIFLAQPETMVDHARLAKWVPDFARRCRRIIADSEYSRNDIVKYLGVSPASIDVVYPGVERATFFPRARDDDGSRPPREGPLKRPYFLAVSCSLGRKNTPFLLEAYATLIRNDPSNDLVLTWSPPEDLRKRYSAGIFADRVHFVGRQSEQSLADLYRGATALVYPSLYEGFGLPVVEAMSCGIPVIASRSSSLPEIGGDAAVYIDPSDPRSLVSALERFENERSLRSTLVEPSLAQASKFSWSRCAQETLAVYERCLSD